MKGAVVENAFRVLEKQNLLRVRVLLKIAWVASPAEYQLNCHPRGISWRNSLARLGEMLENASDTYEKVEKRPRFIVGNSHKRRFDSWVPLHLG